jgi:hypothetical protein
LEELDELVVEPLPVEVVAHSVLDVVDDPDVVDVADEVDEVELDELDEVELDEVELDEVELDEVVSQPVADAGAGSPVRATSVLLWVHATTSSRRNATVSSATSRLLRMALALPGPLGGKQARLW